MKFKIITNFIISGGVSIVHMFSHVLNYQSLGLHQPQHLHGHVFCSGLEQHFLSLEAN